MDLQTVVTSAAVATIVSTAGAMLQGHLEARRREAGDARRRREALLMRAIEMAAAEGAEITKAEATGTARPQMFIPSISRAEAYFAQFEHLYNKGTMTTALRQEIRDEEDELGFG